MKSKVMLKNKNIVLVGMMGSGKSMVAKALAKKLKAPCVSTDDMVEKKAHHKIKSIVAEKGWVHFRALEHKAIIALSKKKGMVIDCGGGVVLDPDNLKLLKKNGIIFHLKATPAVIFKRIKGDPNRPLVHDVPNPLGAITKIYKQRLPLYNQADFIIDASDPSIALTVAQILSKV